MSLSLVFVQQLALTLLLGGLIGLERERAHEMEGLHEFGGIRTLPLISVFAFLAWTFFENGALFSVMTAGFFALILTSYAATAILQRTTGGTTEIAALFAYLLGILVAMGEGVVASGIALIIVGILYFKTAIHAFAHGVEKEELYETLKFLGVVLVLGPLLPNEAMGPWGVLNPYSIWLMVVLISSISFVSYVGVRWLGLKRGLGLVGFLGGLTSSTAVSISFASLSRSLSRARPLLAMGIILASSAMFFRVLLELALVNPPLARELLPSLGLMGTTGIGIALFLYARPGTQKESELHMEKLPFSSPFQLNRAFQFAVFFAVLLVAARFLQEKFGDSGVMVAAGISGLVDVDAISLSMAAWSLTDQVKIELAEQAVFVALVANTLSKGSIVLLFGHAKVGRQVLLAFAAILTVGFFSLLIAS